MSQIVLSTFNARYTHTALGLRYLFANLKELQEVAKIKEFVINTQVADAVESVLSENPKIVGIGAYIWNANEVGEFIEILKKVAPEIIIIVGGPEASYFPHRVDFSGADYFIQGEGDIAFYELCRAIYDDKAPTQKIIKADMVDLNAIKLPYAYYSDEDVAHRQCYVEASRGCPYSCEFCLSSLDKKVRNIEPEKFLQEMETLWNRGVRSFKFIDRTFNQGITTANRLMDFFLSKEPPYFIHFEVIPDNFPESIKERIKEFPPSSLQLEVGIQTLDPVISQNIYRKLNIEKIRKNLHFLENETKAHLHVDLIVGLPGESIEQFGKNLDMLYGMTRCEIQIGILKKLSGTTINRHDEIHGMVYSDKPPYDIYQNNLIPFDMMQKMKRFARFWDMVYNSGNFKKSVTYLFAEGKVFDGFFAFSEWIYEQTESTWQISLDRLAGFVFKYITEVLHVDIEVAKETMIEDVMVVRGRKLPKFLRIEIENKKTRKEEAKTFNKRQLKHST
ncbi:B12-binding domain-containing radical SAM protein [Sulfurospirillum arcachonense]|uniref:B12-binding domain-containing radical SAM protein n=1 Tax=Sulfurospirillum arcachonense TaxID=57666 RepID=UPI000468E839|nr:B12-binding domain-containing radical SAM protein [Sulfurospirillum arcachonense]